MRLLTRSDFDGLACAVFLKEAGVIDHWNLYIQRTCRMVWLRLRGGLSCERTVCGRLRSVV